MSTNHPNNTLLISQLLPYGFVGISVVILCISIISGFVVFWKIAFAGLDVNSDLLIDKTIILKAAQLLDEETIQ